MPLRKLFTKRLVGGSKTTSTMPSPPLQATTVTQNACKTTFHREYLTSPASENKSFLRRFLLRRAVHHSGGTRFPEFLSLPVGEKLREKLKGINNNNSANVDVVSPINSVVYGFGMSVADAKKILKASQLEKVKSKLREIPMNSINYSEFLKICNEVSENRDQGAEFAKMLDDSGNVIVLGNVVFLRPEQVAKTIGSIIYQSIANPNDPRRKELDELEKQKVMMDNKAKAQVRRELYCGLGLLIIQTLGFMRLTFWELSWDVMEPICFFVASLHFTCAYLFFIRTSTEPTFQGFFQQRFKAKQVRLMKKHYFDIHRYNELCKACYPSHHASSKIEPSLPFNHTSGTLLEAMHH